ncbi:hypothetical protein [Nocardioides massiliensis]|uniref:Uncharacterized protein n=1 Tax=Nocardioides massiliensis TaxID=1325935 RepID=A0ABT9NJW3_9ACTN|nr:hypothetical protein [Nocardioides massiliensis]MDP9820699.1 hypothetical protein [Nocardioides massiliensis]
MRITKFFAGAVTIGLLGLPVVTASSAAAEGPAPTVIETRVAETGFSRYLEAYKKPTSIRGQKLSLQARFEAKNPTTGDWEPLPFAADYVVERRLAGQKGYTTIDSGTTRGPIYGKQHNVVRNALYRVRITGGSATIGGTPATFAPSAGTQKLQVMRKFATKINRNRLILSGRIVPKHARKVVHIQRKNCDKGCKWKPFTKIRTNAKSRFSIKLPARNGKRTYFRAVVAKNKHFVKSFSDTYYTIRF